MLCYVMLCYAMLCYVVMSCHVIPRYYVMLCCYVIMLCYVMLSCHVINVMLYHVIMSCHVMLLCYVMLCHVMSCHNREFSLFFSTPPGSRGFYTQTDSFVTRGQANSYQSVWLVTQRTLFTFQPGTQTRKERCNDRPQKRLLQWCFLLQWYKQTNTTPK